MGKKAMPLVAYVVVMVVAVGSVAFASHDFSDVPTSHPFHDDISWMAATGISEGFADGTYRPGEPVTRQAMAAFMRRLAGDDPAVAPMVDAAQLASRTPADYDNAVSLQGNAPDDLLPEYRATTVPDVTVVGTGMPTGTPIVSVPSHADWTLVTFHGIANTGYDSALLTCAEGTSKLIPGMTDLKIGDSTIGYSDRVSISGTFINGPLNPTLQVKCFVESAVGVGAIEIAGASLTAIEVTP